MDPVPFHPAVAAGRTAGLLSSPSPSIPRDSHPFAAAETGNRGRSCPLSIVGSGQCVVLNPGLPRAMRVLAEAAVWEGGSALVPTA